MRFAFTPDQLALTDAARTMLLDTCTPADLRRLLESGEPRDEQRWRTIAEMGLLGMLAPESRGGMGLNLVDFVCVAEAAGYVAQPEPLVELAGIAIPLLAGLDDPGDLLGAAMAGNIVALGAPGSPFVLDADVASGLLLAHGDDVHAVELSAVKLARQESFDPFRRLFRVDWSPDEATRVGAGWSDAAQRGAVLAAAQLVGIGQRVIDMAVAYAGTRTQFGKPIGSYQAVKHLLANAQVKLEFARPVVEAAAAEFPLRTPASRARAAHAKLAAGEAADLAVRNAVQVHGAMGMTWEVDLHFWVKRALALRNAWGSEAQQMQAVLDRVAAGPIGAEFTFASA